MSLKDVKITNFLITVVNVKTKQLKPKNRLIQNFSNTYKLFNWDIDKFFLSLIKGFYPYEYMDSWERFNETTLTIEKAFYSKLYREELLTKIIYMLKKYLKNLI